MSLTSITSVLTCPDGGSSVVISCLVLDVVQGGDDVRTSGGDRWFRDAIVDGSGDGDVPVVPVDRFLAYLTDIGRSPIMVKAYAYDLKDYWSFISFRSLAAVRDGRGDGSDGEPASSRPSARSMRIRPATAPGPVTCWLRGGSAGGAGGSRSCIT